MRHPHDSTSLHTPQHRIEECFFIAIAAFLRGLNALREQPVPSQGGHRGARWGTPGNGVGNAVAHDGEGCGEQGGAASGSRVGNPGEQGGEHGAKALAAHGTRGATPGSRVGSTVEERRAVHTTPQSRESQVDPMERLSPYSPQSHATNQSGAPRSPGAPHSRQLYVYDVSHRPCDYPSVVPDPG